MKRKTPTTINHSITDWLRLINLKSAKKFQTEDNNKSDRLNILHKFLNFSYQKPELLSVFDIINKTRLFKKILKKYKNKIFSIRLIPIKKHLPKLRTDRINLKQNIKWFYKQNINPNDYKVEILPHNKKTLYSAIFIVNRHYTFGEIIKGTPSQLVHGRHLCKPTIFFYNYHRWEFTNNNQISISLIKKTISKLKITDNRKKNKINKLLKSTFTSEGYMEGYYEIMTWPGNKIIFIDYNRLIQKLFSIGDPKVQKGIILKGIYANPGNAIGTIRLINDVKKDSINKKEIMVTKIVSIDHLPFMQKSSGIITEQGGLLSHAAIICREIGKPYIVKVKGATKKLKNGDKVLMNTKLGVIKL